jgi:hypothetical protein
MVLHIETFSLSDVLVIISETTLYIQRLIIV